MSATDTPAGTPGILAALAAFQAEAPVLPKDATNPHFRSRYTPLDTIVERIQPLLTKHGLTWSTFPTFHEGEQGLRYMLGHPASGETLDGTMPLVPVKRDPQAQGSAITYARRYALCAVLNLVADEDDDGNGATSAAAQPESTVAKDADRPAAPRIPIDRAKAILETAKAAALVGDDDAFTPVLKAKLAEVGVTKIGALDVDQAEVVEAFLRDELAARSEHDGEAQS